MSCVVVYFDNNNFIISKASDIISYNILLEKQMKNELDNRKTS